MNEEERNLRDQFALAAIPSVTRSYLERYRDTNGEQASAEGALDWRGIAQDCFSLADAMIEQRRREDADPIEGPINVNTGMDL